jgi:hypothetical protein
MMNVRRILHQKHDQWEVRKIASYITIRSRRHVYFPSCMRTCTPVRRFLLVASYSLKYSFLLEKQVSLPPLRSFLLMVIAVRKLSALTF